MEDTQTMVKDPDRESLISEMLRDAGDKKMELPSELDKTPVLNPEDRSAPPTVVNKVTSAGYVYVWDSRTFKKAPVLYYMLPQILRTKREDGSYRWTTNDPGQLPKRGAYKCWLHKDDPNRSHYDDLGFRTCRKDNITNPYQVTQHMKSRHKAEYAAIEEERRQAERQEDRDLQRALIRSSMPKEGTIIPIAEDTVPEPSEKPLEPRDGFICKDCGQSCKSEAGLVAHRRAHKK